MINDLEKKLSVLKSKKYSVKELNKGVCFRIANIADWYPSTNTWHSVRRERKGNTFEGLLWFLQKQNGTAERFVSQNRHGQTKHMFVDKNGQKIIP